MRSLAVFAPTSLKAARGKKHSLLYSTSSMDLPFLLRQDSSRTIARRIRLFDAQGGRKGNKNNTEQNKSKVHRRHSRLCTVGAHVNISFFLGNAEMTCPKQIHLWVTNSVVFLALKQQEGDIHGEPALGHRQRGPCPCWAFDPVRPFFLCSSFIVFSFLPIHQHSALSTQRWNGGRPCESCATRQRRAF